MLGLTSRGVRVEFAKEGLSFTGDDSALSTLLPSVMGALEEFERSLILKRQREGIAIAKAAGVYKGRQPILAAHRADELRKGWPAANGKLLSPASSTLAVRRSIVISAREELPRSLQVLLHSSQYRKQS